MCAQGFACTPIYQLMHILLPGKKNIICVRVTLVIQYTPDLVTHLVCQKTLTKEAVHENTYRLAKTSKILVDYGILVSIP
jgi:hypothetical protein